MNIGINIRPDNTDALSYLHKFVNILSGKNVNILLPDYDILKKDFAQYINKDKDFINKANVVVAIGGDGTTLKTARLCAESKKPVFSINKGKFGFLTEFLADEAELFIDNLIANKFSVSERDLIKAIYQKNNTKHEFLNDAIIARTNHSRMITLEIEIDGKYLSTFACDGIIISTATGSTAYALSAGGPIVVPEIGNLMIIVPVCAHTLAVRPLVIPSASILKVKAISKHDDFLLTFDGQESMRISNNDEIIFTHTDKKAYFIKNPTRHYYDTLREKFGWGKLA